MDRPRGENVIDLMDVLKRSISGDRTQSTPQSKAKPKRSRTTASGQKEMLLPIAGKSTGSRRRRLRPSPPPTQAQVGIAMPGKRIQVDEDALMKFTDLGRWRMATFGGVLLPFVGYQSCDTTPS